MSKVLVVYWSGTGNTEMMAKSIGEGVRAGGKEVDVLTVSDADPGKLGEYDTIAFGCPSMGDEVLEEAEMEPFFTEAEERLSGKKIALFGSYGWGDGQWMRDWCERAKAAGANLMRGEGLMANETPSDDDLEACKQFGAELAKF